MINGAEHISLHCQITPRTDSILSTDFFDFKMLEPLRLPTQRRFVLLDCKDAATVGSTHFRGMNARREDVLPSLGHFPHVHGMVQHHNRTLRLDPPCTKPVDF